MLVPPSLENLIKRLPENCIELNRDVFASRLVDWYQIYRGDAFGLARPRTVKEISIIMAWAHDTRTPITVQGGNTGLSGGAIPDQSGQSLLLSLERMNAIRWISGEDNALIAEAGVILSHIQEAASSIDRYFPLHLSTEGSCQIGGNLATNAGGINVLRYGMMRDLTLGLEIVLADGRIISDLRPLRKNNSGYDWKQIFIGSEGTLGIISAACLKLFPAIEKKATAFLALNSLEYAPDLLNLIQKTLDYRLLACELLPQKGLELAKISAPTEPAAYYLLLEAGGHGEIPLQEAMEFALKKNFIIDAVLAQNEAQAKQLWRIREKIVEAQKAAPYVIRHDIAISVANVPSFIKQASHLINTYSIKHKKNITLLAFGHLGDGNIHFNLLAETPEPDLHHLVQDLLKEMNGTFSAEHGIGQARLNEMRRYKSPEELHLMRMFKKTLDPCNILNPGKVLPLPVDKD